MRFFSVRWRITFGLVCLLTSLLVIAELIGMVPNENRATLRGRARLCESIAISSSAFVNSNDIRRLERVLELVVDRNRDLESAAVRRSDGTTLIEIGDHLENWQNIPDDRSTETHVHVPIRAKNKHWGTIQMRFRSVGGGGVGNILQSPAAQFLGFIGAASFLCFWFYLGRTLQQLDPSKAVPKRVRSALDTLAEGLLVIDKQDRIVLANEAFSAWLGKTPEMLMGQGASTLPWNTKLPSGEKIEFPWRQAMSEEQPNVSAVLQLTDSESKERTLVVNSSPVLGQNGRYGGVLTSFEDITELEESRAALTKARDAADTANRAKSDFLARMSHEIRTPMNAILGFTDVLRRGFDKTITDRQRYLDTIHNSGEHLLALINDILDLSKIESGRMELELTRVSPYELLSHVLTVFQMKAQEKHVRLDFSCDGKIPATILTDKVRLRQTVMNLVSNAVKFTEDGTVRVVIRLIDETSAQPKLVINVIDSGLGIPEDAIDNIFNPFAQADSSITRRFGGTGLGLAIVRQLAEALGGRVTVTSTTGVGSTFSVYIATGPLDGVDLLDGQDLTQRHVAASVTASMQRVLPSCRILVVEDGEANRELIKLFLDELGANAHSAENGQIALDRMSEFAYDAVLMDMQMPVMDGYTATQRLRELGYSLPIIALTAHAMQGDEAKCMDAGCSGFLTKPIDIDQLYEALRDVLPSTDGSTEQVIAEQVEQTSQDLREALFGASAEYALAGGAPLVCRLPIGDARFRPVIEKFVKRLHEQLAEMHAAAEGRDYTTLRELAHWLKGTGGTAGFDDFTKPAANLEQFAIDADEVQIRSCLELLTQLSRRIELPAELPA